MLDKFLSLIYNKKCLICGCSKVDNLLCKTCSKDVQILSSFAHRFQDEIPIYSAYIYDGTIRKLIHQLKFQHRKKAAIPLANLLLAYFKKLNLDDDFIITYPSGYGLRNAYRGYNPIFMVVKEFSTISKIDYIENLIIKTKHTKPQYKAKNKVKNIQGSFKLDKKKLSKIKDKTILLIDDITTSGATLDELIKLFKNENVNKLVCLTIAKSAKL